MQNGTPLGVKNADSGLVNGETAPGSPIRTVRLTSPPSRLGVGAVGAAKARLSFEVTVSVLLGAIGAVFTDAASVWVLQKSVGDSAPGGPSNVYDSCPA